MRVVSLTFALVLFTFQDAKTETSDNIKTNDVVQFTVSLGQSVPVTIQNEWSDSVTGCFLQQSGQAIIQFRPQNLNTNEDFRLHAAGMTTGCGVTINNVKEEYLGDWELISWLLGSDQVERQVVQPFVIIDADTPSGNDANEVIPTPESTLEASSENIIEQSPELSSEQTIDLSKENNNNREIQTRDHVTYQTQLNKSVQIRIAYDLLNIKENCYLKTPEGLYLDLESEVPAGLVLVDGSIHSSCMIEMTVTENMHGEWILYSHESVRNSGKELEIQQPFTIYVEEPIDAFPKDIISIETGKDLYIRLNQPIQDLESCDLITPASAENREFTRDSRYENTCGFKVQNVATSDSGLWEVKAVGKIAYRASLQVSVEESDHPETLQSIILTHGEAVSMELGPENALFCQMKDPSGAVAFSGFSQCKMELSRVVEDHEGLWSMTVGLPGRLTALEQVFHAEVEDAVLNLNTVSSSIREESDSMTLSCSMLTDREMRACKFIRPDSTIFIVNEGVGEGRYSFYGQGTSTSESGHLLVDCGLHITSPSDVDFGTWRCLLEMEDQTNNGFLRVSTMTNAEEDLASLLEETVLDTTLTTTTSAVVVVAGDMMTISCNVESHIEYCWFRSQNGTVFSVRPDTHAVDYEYAGSGFDSGECGIKFKSSSVQDTGRWTCNVGLLDRPDQSVQVNVTVLDSPLVARYWYGRTGRHSFALVVEARVYNGTALDYCRFVTPGGVGFHTNSHGTGYDFSGTDLSKGICRVTVVNPGWHEDGVWVVSGVLSLWGQEVSSYTGPRFMWQGPVYSFYSAYMLMVFLLIFLNIMFISALVNKKSRRWTTARVTTLGTSIRNSFRRHKNTNEFDTERRDEPNGIREEPIGDRAAASNDSSPPPAYAQAVLVKP